MQNGNQKLPEPGEFYRHFKGGLYQILSIATHSESGEKLVVYQALYDDFSVYARPLAMFIENINREEDSEEKEKPRFEKIDRKSLRGSFDKKVRLKEGREESRQDSHKEKKKESSEREDLSQAEVSTEETVGEYFFAFLESKTYAEKRETINRYKNQYTQKDLNGIYTVLEIAPFEGDVQKQIQGVIKYLTMQSRFETRRLRNE